MVANLASWHNGHIPAKPHIDTNADRRVLNWVFLINGMMVCIVYGAKFANHRVVADLDAAMSHDY
jgi:hypothetical protein